MGKTIKEITPDIKAWIEKQKLFFVATAPLSNEGHVNCSPKGLDSFRIISPIQVAYQDLTGSGVETIAHIQENERITIMFCALEGPPKILRLYGKGEIIYPEDSSFEIVAAQFPKRLGVRAYIVIHITDILDSCGYAVPKFEFKSERDVLTKWCEKKGEEGVINYQQRKNKLSLDGLKGLKNIQK